MKLLDVVRERTYFARDLGSTATRHLKASGEVVRVCLGGYLRMDPDWQSWDRARAVNIARTLVSLEYGDGARACLTSCAVLYELPIWQPVTTVDLLVPRCSWRKPLKFPAVLKEPIEHPEVLKRHCYAVDDGDFREVGGVPTLDVARLVLDVALFWHPRDALVVVDAILATAARSSRLDRQGTEARAAAIQGEWLRKLEGLSLIRGKKRAAVIIASATPWSESPGESVTRWGALAMGLPEPICQYEFTRRNGRCYYLDLFWELYGRGIEFDGRVKYMGDRPLGVILTEKDRDEEIRRGGISLKHMDIHDVKSPGALGRALRDAVPAEVWKHTRPRPELWVPGFPRWS
ncbi:MAG TPA: hypothetical protein VFC82_09745 [Actinomycetaceae bacterium]|nr:hypothetical protein [Actinomycetaceae bacterium]